MTKKKVAVLGICFSFLLCLLFLGLIEWLHIHRNIPYGNLTRDPNAINESPKYIGILSQTGMIFWFSTVGVLLFSSLLMIKYFKDIHHGIFIANAFLLTFFLGIDDMFMLHDELAHRGIREEYFYLFYSIWLFFTLYFFRKTIKHTAYPIILAYLLFFGISVSIDKLIKEAYLLEDLLKFAGIINWCIYWISSCYVLFLKHLQSREVTRVS